MFPGFPGRYVTKREPLNCITRVRSQVVTISYSRSNIFTEPRRGGPGYWLWISLKQDFVPEELLAIINALNHELRAGAPIAKCPGGMALRDWLEQHQPNLVGEFDNIVVRRGYSRPDRGK